MKDILQALDRALERGEVKSSGRFDIMAALERAVPDVISKPVAVFLPQARHQTEGPAVSHIAQVRHTNKNLGQTEAPDERPLRGEALRLAMAELHAAQPDREPWPDSWFTYADASDGYRCQQMWAECLRVCLVDAADQACKTFEAQAKWDATPEKMRKGPRPLPRNAWVGTSDFMQVCALAGLDGQAVLDQVAPKLTQPKTAAELGIALSGAARRGFANVRSSFGGGEAAA